MPKIQVGRRFLVTAFTSSFSRVFPRDYVFNGESHEMWEMVFVREGEAEATENERVYPLGKNTLVIHAPWEFHCLRSAGGTSPEIYVMSFLAEGELPAALRSGVFRLSESEAVEHMENCKRVMALFAHGARGSYAAQEAADRLAAFLASISRAEPNPSQGSSSSLAVEYRRFATVMAGSVTKNRTLADFAAECGSSVSYMKQLFSKYAGVSPKMYYNKLRVLHAMRLLDEGLSVCEVAEQMNFSSSNYFSVFFERHAGSTPMEYKKPRM
jgi:AraC-like DNA-binding protein